ncbi:hypothetical protein L210DRAFT_3658420 [Boletus edulis BED1]|uniref:Uncharacterized protein n=1 Tax=Boletus edulis BED1 TaxID=1328754 RepID=A0AAD4G5U1_BOLED|nr:hypothetical protein L210DRAFT_3658420 [Boletus edulis BED1]
MDEEAAAKHAAFVRARGRHYSNEAEAMKKAASFMDDDDDEETGRGEGAGDGDVGVDEYEADDSQVVDDVSLREDLVNGDAHGA